MIEKAYQGRGDDQDGKEGQNEGNTLTKRTDDTRLRRNFDYQSHGSLIIARLNWVGQIEMRECVKKG